MYSILTLNTNKFSHPGIPNIRKLVIAMHICKACFLNSTKEATGTKQFFH